MNWMHTSPRIREWMLEVHDRGVEAVHSTEHVFRERTFWIVLSALAFAALLLVLAVMLGEGVVVEIETLPPPYGP